MGASTTLRSRGRRRRLRRDRAHDGAAPQIWRPPRRGTDDAGQMTHLLGAVHTNALVVAAPLRRWRLWSRRYNQALLIGRGVVGGPVSSACPIFWGAPAQRLSCVPWPQGTIESGRGGSEDATYDPADRRCLYQRRYDRRLRQGAQVRGSGGSPPLCWARVLREEEGGR
jgi:hypothetical protein